MNLDELGMMLLFVKKKHHKIHTECNSTKPKFVNYGNGLICMTPKPRVTSFILLVYVVSALHGDVKQDKEQSNYTVKDEYY